MEKNNVEQQIIEAAKQVFVEKGFAETSMSDIAVRAGINRPALHYYFRTKERMFEAVFADLVCSFAPSITEAIQQDAPIADRIARVVDIYADVLRRNPHLPLFAMKEIRRDAAHILASARRIDKIAHTAQQVATALQGEMAAGNIRRMPLEHVFYTFYGLLFIPFLTAPLINSLLPRPAAPFDQRLEEWKAQAVRQLCYLLLPA